jgi:peroxiredoxin Q/BCP
MADEMKASTPLSAGSTAPDFSLPARSGKTISLHDYRGSKDVLIYFYPKDDTPGCTRESCSLRDSWGELQGAGIEVLGVSRDDSASHNAFAAKYNLPFELLTDADHAVHEAYGAWGQNPNPAWGVGPLRKSFLVGKDGRIRHVFDKVDTEHHAEQVLRAAGVAVAPKPAPAPAPQPAPKPAAPAAAAPAPAPKPAAPPAPKPPAPKPPAPKPPTLKPPAPPAPKPAAPVAKASPKKKAAPKKKKAATKKKAAKKKTAKKSSPKRKAARKSAPKRRSKSRPAKKSAPKKRKAAKKSRKPAKKSAKRKKR